MMEHNTEKLLSAIGDVDAAYLEEALDFDAANAGRKRAARFPKLSAACVAGLVILGVSVTAFAVSRLPLSWRDIFSPEQTVIGDGDETPVVSQQQPTAAAEELHIRVEKVISDERALYLLYSVKANEGAVLDQSGQFADFELYFPGQMMSGAYVSSFLPRKEGVPENELEGVVYANWQPGSSAAAMSSAGSRHSVRVLSVRFMWASFCDPVGRSMRGGRAWGGRSRPAVDVRAVERVDEQQGQFVVHLLFLLRCQQDDPDRHEQRLGRLVRQAAQRRAQHHALKDQVAERPAAPQAVFQQTADVILYLVKRQQRHVLIGRVHDLLAVAPAHILHAVLRHHEDERFLP